MKRVTNLLHLLAGVALLVVACYFFRELAHNGKRVWQRESSVVGHPAKSARSASGSDDPTLNAADVKMDGASGQPDEGTGGDDAVPAPARLIGSSTLMSTIRRNIIWCSGIPRRSKDRALWTLTLRPASNDLG